MSDKLIDIKTETLSVSVPDVKLDTLAVSINTYTTQVSIPNIQTDTKQKDKLILAGYGEGSVINNGLFLRVTPIGRWLKPAAI